MATASAAGANSADPIGISLGILAGLAGDVALRAVGPLYDAGELLDALGAPQPQFLLAV
jgi:hypothetical protein